MTIREDDQRKAQAFCDDIGCTKVHHLREQLPGFVANIREGERDRCLLVVVTEEELIGNLPSEHQALLNVVDKVGVARLTVIATKRSIARRIVEEDLHEDAEAKSVVGAVKYTEGLREKVDRLKGGRDHDTLVLADLVKKREALRKALAQIAGVAFRLENQEILDLCSKALEE